MSKLWFLWSNMKCEIRRDFVNRVWVIPNRWRCSWWILWCLAAWLCLASNSIEWLIPPDAGKNITRCFRCKYPEYSWISSPTQKWPNTIGWIGYRALRIPIKDPIGPYGSIWIMGTPISDPLILDLLYNFCFDRTTNNMNKRPYKVYMTGKD